MSADCRVCASVVANVPEECPACGRPAAYVRAWDRFVHTDGSGNELCWWAATRRAGSGRVPSGANA
jgi:hypothetical protein